MWEELEAEPPIEEIDDAIRKLNFTAAGHDGITAGMWKVLARDDDFFFFLTEWCDPREIFGKMNDCLVNGSF